MRVFDEHRPATLDEIAWMRRALGRKLSELRLSEELVADLQLVLSELGANAVLHGAPAPTTVSLHVDLAGADIKVEFFDDGGPFDTAAHMAQAEAPLAGEHIDPLTTSGRGLWLAREALDSAAYRRDGGNRFLGRRSLRRRRPVALVVEDSTPLLNLYTQMLRRDYRVIGCGSLEEARAILGESTIDVVLADVHLGDGDGGVLPGEIAERDDVLAAPVVLISSDHSDATHETMLRHGAEFFLTKPVRPKALREKLELAVSRSALRGARLARGFARDVDGFIKTRLPKRLRVHRAASASATASTGGGDLLVHLKSESSDRVVLIDVIGHGVGALAWAIAYAAIARTLHYAAPGLSTSAFLTELARITWREPTLERALATALVVDLDSSGATFASAGHPSPLVFAREIRRFPMSTPPLGVLEPRPFESQHIALSVGERLALFTDGLDPAGVAAGDDPPPWFVQTLLGGADLALDEAVDRLRAATEAALGPQPKDDWTFVVIEKAEA